MSQTHYLTALAHHRAGQLTQAEPLYLQSIALHPQQADALHMLGVLYYQTNRSTEAISYIERALAIHPRNVDYLNNFGLILRTANQPEAAIKTFQQAALLQPKDLDIQLNLGNTLMTLNRFEEASGYYRRVLRAFPKNDEVRAALCHCLSSLGNQAHATGNYALAEACFQEAISFNQQDAALYYNLGNAQRELGKAADAAKQYQKSIQLAPHDADSHNNLGNVQRELGQLDLAIASYQQALRLNPQLYHAKVHLVHQKQHACDWQGLKQDIAEIRHWVKTVPQAQVSPFAFLSMPGTTAEEQKLCADNWVRNRYAALFAQAKAFNFELNRTKARKIRIGYLSADFRLHPLAFLISELIELHDRSQFEVLGFSFGVNDKTPARARLVKAFDQFHDVRNLSESDAAKKIHACGIDILVDLTGFTQTSRSGIAALRPAPVNVNWLGFPGTMGECVEHSAGKQKSQPLFDYILSDAFISPPETAAYYAEKLALLPDCYQPNDRLRPIGKTPARQDCGLPEGAFVFCSFNQTFKITPDVFAAWMRLLKSTPGSVLWLLECNRWAKENLIREAATFDIAGERLIFAPRVSIDEHLARHVHADLFLDTQPYNAHTTCSDALWMNLPVLTCAGNTFASRVAGSLLSALDLNELITYSMQDYEYKANYLANNPQALLEIKQKLISNKTQKPLFKTDLFAQALENSYRKMWQDYVLSTKTPE